MLTDAGRWAEDFKSRNPRLGADADKLINILEKDYSEEVDNTLKNPEALEILNSDYTKEVYGKGKTGEE